jgi:cytochrome c6
MIDMKKDYTITSKLIQHVLFLFFSFFFLFFSNQKALAKNLENGEILFLQNCNVCHKNRNNLIIPEKNLKKEALETNGMYNLEAIVYQITNGKNAMPAFGGRLTDIQIQTIAEYVLEKADS